MARWLKQSTSVDVPIGPFVDQTDGFTAETGLTLTQPDIRLKKNAGNWAQKNASQTLSHEENGYYEVTLDTTDTNTLGLLRLAVNESGALPVWEDFLVVPANVWDSLFGSDVLDVSMTQILGTAVSTPATAGILDVNVKNIDNDAASASGTVTFPNATLASTTNITAGTITTATNVTTVNGLAAGVITAASIAADAITDAKVASDVTIASVTGAVGSVTAGVTVTTNNDKTGYRLSATGVDDVLDEAVEGTRTLRQMLRGFASALLGKVSGMATNAPIFRDIDDSKNRITATTDADGNRSAITLDLT